MALDASRLAAAIGPQIASKVRDYILDGDHDTELPDLDSFAQAVAEAIATEVVAEVTGHAEIKDGFVTGTIAGTVTGATCEVELEEANTELTGGIE